MSVFFAWWGYLSLMKKKNHILSCITFKEFISPVDELWSHLIIKKINTYFVQQMLILGSNLTYPTPQLYERHLLYVVVNIRLQCKKSARNTNSSISVISPLWCSWNHVQCTKWCRNSAQLLFEASHLLIHTNIQNIRKIECSEKVLSLI